MVKSKRLVFLLIFFLLISSILTILPTSNGNLLNTKNKADLIDRWAVVVGISNYPGTLNDLSFCDDDALEMKAWLMGQNFPVQNIKVLINSNATKANILNSIGWLASNSEGDDYVFFFYSGHGDKSGATTKIVPYDYVTDISESEIGSAFNSISCSKMIALFDSCYSGGLIDSVQGPNRIIISACTESESSAESPFLMQGIFTFFFLQSYINLNADYDHDGKVMIEEAFQYTKNYSLNYGVSLFQNPQTAQLSDNIAGDFFLSPYL